MSESNPTSSGATSLSLLERARGRDSEAWHGLVQLYSPLVFSWALRAGLGEADAADLVQEVWLSVAAALDEFRRDRQSGTFRGWLWTIARNKIHDHFRKRQGQPEAAGGTTARQVLEAVPEQEPADEAGAEDHRLLHRALELLRPQFEERTWRAFWGLTVEGRPAADVGAELGMAANAVHQARFRVLRRLREEMAGLVDA
ncbi:MAG: sigma-70 family RNA polymerase sigma factor [Planctomycetes bacterium]|nr:sigma-70 family RNA polymerase sigma factor [Planctomycetota bacterium]